MIALRSRYKEETDTYLVCRRQEDWSTEQARLVSSLSLAALPYSYCSILLPIYLLVLSIHGGFTFLRLIISGTAFFSSESPIIEKQGVILVN